MVNFLIFSFHHSTASAGYELYSTCTEPRRYIRYSVVVGKMGEKEGLSINKLSHVSAWEIVFVHFRLRAKAAVDRGRTFSVSYCTRMLEVVIVQGTFSYVRIKSTCSHIIGYVPVPTLNRTLHLLWSQPQYVVRYMAVATWMVQRNGKMRMLDERTSKQTIL